MSQDHAAHATAKPKRRGLAITTGIIAGLFGLCAIAYGVDYALTQDQVPRGTTVAGVNIGGMSADDAQRKLESELGKRVAEPVMLMAGTKQSKVAPADAGLSVNWAKTIESAGTPSLNPIDRLTSFFTTHEVGIVSDVDDAALAPELERLRLDLSAAPIDASVNLQGGKVNATQPVDGQKIDPEQLRSALTANWLNPAGVDVPSTVQHPDIDAADLKKIVDGEAARAVSAPIVVRGREGINGEIPVDRMHEVVAFVPHDGELKSEVNVETAQAILAEGLGKSEVKKKNAKISFSGGEKVVTPSADGVKVDWEKVMADFPARVTGKAERSFEAVYADEKASFTTEMAQTATFDDTVGTFTTSGFSGPSGVNIAKTAELVNGAIVAPGETFSLNGWTGTRGAAQGFVESGIILNGHADKAIGGGISQFATTLYNAYYFAGMEDVTHTPHSYYISRYPAGREATVYDGAIDLAFRNNSDYPVMITAGVSGNSVTVSLMGVKTVEVESVSGGRWAPTQPKEMKVPGDSCSPSSGAPGFTTSDTRIIRSLSGAEISRETTTTVYDPQPIVRCG